MFANCHLIVSVPVYIQGGPNRKLSAPPVLVCHHVPLLCRPPVPVPLLCRPPVLDPRSAAIIQLSDLRVFAQHLLIAV
jgi:hypothetical protein